MSQARNFPSMHIATGSGFLLGSPQSASGAPCRSVRVLVAPGPGCGRAGAVRGVPLHAGAAAAAASAAVCSADVIGAALLGGAAAGAPPGRRAAAGAAATVRDWLRGVAAAPLADRASGHGRRGADILPEGCARGLAGTSHAGRSSTSFAAARCRPGLQAADGIGYWAARSPSPPRAGAAAARHRLNERTELPMTRIALEPYFVHQEQVQALIGPQRTASALARVASRGNPEAAAPYVLAKRWRRRSRCWESANC